MRPALNAALCLLGLALLPALAEASLKLRTAIPLEDLAGRLDDLALDGTRQRLFVAALAADCVEVVDLKEGRQVHRLTGCSRPQGVLYLSKPNLLYVANGGSGTVKVFDGATYRALKTLGSLPEADQLRFDPAANRVYVGFGDGALGVINPLTGVHTTTLQLLGHPEGFVIESTGHRAWVNVPKAGHVAILDRRTQRLEEAWMLSGFEENHALAVDETRQRLFVGCRRPPRLAVLNSTDGNPVCDLPLAGDCHSLLFDARQGRIYAVCGEGFVCVIDQLAPDSYRAREPVRSGPGSRAGAYSAERQELFVAVPQQGRRPAEIRCYRAAD